MAKKRICDFCEKDITNDLIFELGIYDVLLEEDTYQRDMCEKCTKKMKKLIKDAKL